MIRAPSITRDTSSDDMTPSVLRTATTAWLLVESTCAPAIPTRALIALKPDCCSARRNEDSIAETAACTSTTTPLRNPCEGQMPTPRISGEPDAMSAMRVHTFVVPTSMPTIIWSAEMVLPPGLSIVRPFEKPHVDELRRLMRGVKVSPDRLHRIQLRG